MRESAGQSMRKLNMEPQYEIATSGNNDGMAVSIIKYTGRCDCDIVYGSTLKCLYGVAAVSDTTTSENNTTITA